MPIAYPAVLPAPWAAYGDKANIPLSGAPAGRATWGEGWGPVNSQPLGAGGIPPNRLDINAALYALSQHVFWQQSGGMYVWNNLLDYLPSALVWHNGVLYTAVAASGPGHGGAEMPGIGSRWATFINAVVGVQNYATTNLDNLTVAGGAAMAGAGMPGRGINVSLPNGGTYTAPAAGWMVYNRNCSSDTDSQMVGLLNTARDFIAGGFSLGGHGVTAILPVSQGDVVKNISEATGEVFYSKFFYARTA